MAAAASLVGGRHVTVAVIARRADATAAFREAHRAFHAAAGAAVDPGVDAEWTIDSSENEFWWPHGAKLDALLDAIPDGFDAVQAVVRRFVAIDDGSAFAERMIYRLAPEAPLADRGLPRPERRLIRHSGARAPLRPLRGWYPIEVLCFDAGPPQSPHDVQDAVAVGILRLDTRLRDALRAIGEGREPTFEPPTLAEAGDYALDVAALGEADVLAAHGRLDALEERLSAVESTLPAMAKRTLRRLLDRRAAGLR